MSELIPHRHAVEIELGAEAWRTRVKIDGKETPVSRVIIDTGENMSDLVKVTLELDLLGNGPLRIAGAIFASDQDFERYLRLSEGFARELGMRKLDDAAVR